MSVMIAQTRLTPGQCPVGKGARHRWIAAPGQPQDARACHHCGAPGRVDKMGRVKVVAFDHLLLRGYAERYFQRADKTAWPTVKHAARALGWIQERVLDAVAGDPDGKLMLTWYAGVPVASTGEHFVEVC